MKIVLLTAFIACAAGILHGAEIPPIKIEERFIPKDRPWRPQDPVRKMKPTFITIHSTANTTKGADAAAHDRLLSGKHGMRSLARDAKGKIIVPHTPHPHSRTGYATWHFTVDDQRIVQHLPTSEQGDHADFTGKGNQVSVGIEICVNKDGDIKQAVQRAAALTAHLMKELKIDIEQVVPHYHWPQPPNGYKKPCPSILMDDGEPGKKWNAFKQQISAFRKQL